MGVLEERLKNCHMTKTYKSIAEFCLQNKQSIPLLSSTEIAQHVNVSDVSVIRFTKSLGYSCFADFKHDMQQELTNKSLISDDSSPIVHYLTQRADGENASDISNQMIASYQQIIQNIFQNNEPAVFEKVAKVILSSQNRYILGIRFRSSIAETCANLLRMTTSNVFQIPAADYKALQFAMDFTRADCLIWFNFGRFTNFEKQMLEMVKKSNIYLIVISDVRSSSVSLAADIFIQSYGHTTLPFYSSVGNCIIAELIANAVTNMGWSGAEKRLREYETGLSTSVVPEEQ
ncbi:MAG: MurR/RpiR family transcriptional regulator [Lachnospiraceae bacterium]|nr:MurR/RpiR family transcriptional regulator [Lachnospiraceae bacterium]